MKTSKEYIKLHKDQIDKIGNAIIFLSEKLQNLSKTKILKLLYILDELSIKRTGIPFVNLQYEVWKFGPVSKEIFIDLTTDMNLLAPYIRREIVNDKTYFTATTLFNDDEFSDNDIALLNEVVEKFGTLSTQKLIKYTHKEESPWYRTAVKHQVLDALIKEEINNTDYLVDMSQIISYDKRKKQIFNEYQEMFG